MMKYELLRISNIDLGESIERVRIFVDFVVHFLEFANVIIIIIIIIISVFCTAPNALIM